MVLGECVCALKKVCEGVKDVCLCGALAFEIQIVGFGVNLGVKCNQLDCIILVCE